MPCTECQNLAPSTCIDHPAPKAIPIAQINQSDFVVLLINDKRRRFRVSLKRSSSGVLVLRDSSTNKRYGIVGRPDQHVDFCQINDANEVTRVQAARVPVVQVMSVAKILEKTGGL